jgi:hypothetical protein
MKKIILSFFGVLLVILSILGTLNYYKNRNWHEEQLRQTNLEIEKLTKQIRLERRETLNAQIEANGLMRVEWNAYLEKVKEVDKHEEKINLLEQQLKSLKAEKENIIKTTQPAKKS